MIFMISNGDNSTISNQCSTFLILPHFNVFGVFCGNKSVFIRANP